MGQPYIGQIIAVGFNFAPVGWVSCDGSLLPISEYSALFNLIGTTYGGDGQNTFAVPDLRGRSPLAAGQGQGLPVFVQGQIGGSESVSLTASQVGSHSHNLMASAQTGTVANPATNLALAQNAQPAVFVYGPPPSTTPLAGAAIAPSTGGQPHENRQPFLTINYIMSLFGVFPSQG
jgi:microcystin-dependent protein